VKNYLKLAINHKRPARFVVARLLMSTGLCRLFRIRQRGYELWFHAANLSSQLWIDPTERDDALKFFRDYLKPGDRVVDVGANIGDTVLVASTQVGGAGHVVGLEAHPRTFRCLEENVRLNRATNVKLIESAVGAESRMIRFSNDRRDDMNMVGGGTLLIRMNRLDDLLSSTLPVTLLKIDVEGYERFVLEGATETLRRTQCVYCEVCAAHFRRFGYATRDVLQLLWRAGFLLYRVIGPSRLIAIGADFEAETYENLIALREIDEFCARTHWMVQEA
jgi:FkbM family methyltransferase